MPKGVQIAGGNCFALTEVDNGDGDRLRWSDWQRAVDNCPYNLYASFLPQGRILSARLLSHLHIVIKMVKC